MTRQERRQNPDYRIAELEAQVERLRTALERITGETFYSHKTDAGFVVPSKMVHEWRTIARRALEGSE